MSFLMKEVYMDGRSYFERSDYDYTKYTPLFGN